MPKGGKQYFFGTPPAGDGKKKGRPMATALANFKKKGAFGRKGGRRKS